MIYVAVKPELLQWAQARSGRNTRNLAEQFPKLARWERGEAQPTLKQLERFARATFVPVGYFFLAEPPEERIPIPDLRTVGGQAIAQPSPHLLDTIYACQRRQAWYQDWARTAGEDRRRFVGSAKLDSPVEDTAARMRQTLGFDLEARHACHTWTEALRQFIQQADDAGILVMVSGVVGNNNHRPLDPDEFRGFALADPLAPLVFINGADTKAAQMFTLAHELAHLWLGESALTNVTPTSAPTQRIESWCNRVAAELLVPLAAVRQAIGRGEPLDDVPRLARRFKVSTLVILRRLFDARRLTRPVFDDAYADELARLLALPTTSGGDFYLTQASRLSRRFARALVGSTLEGHTLFRDASMMLGFTKESTFRELAASLGYAT
jgi:Zn-dependent peptidase ImmA (M78 family)